MNLPKSKKSAIISPYKRGYNMEIIKGIERFIDDKKEQLAMSINLNYYQNIAISMIINFLNELSKLTGNNIDINKIEKEIRAYKLQIFNGKDYSGRCHWAGKVKVIDLNSEILKNDKKKAINVLIHENSHALSYLSIGSEPGYLASIEEGMAEIFTNLVLNFWNEKNTYYDESYFYNKEILSFLLANTSCPFDLVYSYYFVSKTAFNRKLIDELRFRNLNLIEIFGFFGPDYYVHDSDYVIEKIIKSTLSNMPIDYLYHKCSHDIFYFDNYYIQSYLADVNMNPNINISNIELLLIENHKKDLSGKFLCNRCLLSELSNRDPSNFYRIRPYIHDRYLSEFRVKEMNLQFSNIVTALRRGYLIPNILNYTWCYNCHAADYNKFLFLKALIKSDGIRNGFLCNECLEVTNNLKEELEFNITIMLVEESVKQFFKWNINNIEAPYDHYTHMILAKSKALLEELQIYDQCYNMVCQYLNKLNTEINYVSQFAPDFFSNIYALNNRADVLILSEYDPNISILTKYFKELSIQRFNGQVPRLPVASQKRLVFKKYS